MTEETTPRRVRVPKTLVIWTVIIILVAAIGIGGTIIVAKKRPEILGLSSTVEGSQQELDQLIADVKKLIVLPDEQPNVATISDIDKLRDQPFFTKAQNGDKVLIFTNAKKAILYRPSSRLIIDVAQITIGPTSTASATPSPSIASESGTPTIIKTSIVTPTPGQSEPTENGSIGE